MPDNQALLEKEVAQIGGSFSEELTRALENYHDPIWLGENSPLAAPYFLSRHLSRSARSEIADAARRGQALQQLLREAVDLLAGEEGAENRDLIALSYFQGKSSAAIIAELGMGRATFFRRRKQAVNRLEPFFNHCLKPALRLEAPRSLFQLVGRDSVIDACTESLRQGQTVGLTGPGGIGKTALGAHLATHALSGTAFWYTLRPGLNDRLGSLLFTLGYFLHQQGQPTLWGELVAGTEPLKPEIALSLLRYELKQVRGAPPLLCFDEVDLLRPAEIEAHAQLMTFLESLRGLTPLLFMGQHLILEPDALHHLAGLQRSEAERMLVEAGLSLPVETLTRLFEYTRGNPRLLELFIALHQAGEPVAETLADHAGAPSMEYLLDRIWRRLNDAEQELLTLLALFQRPAPGDALGETLPRLIDRRLVQTDDQGGVMLLPAFRDVIYRQLTPENRQALHLRVAAIRAVRSEYTAAAYHYVKAEQPQTAVWLWHEHQEQEINQGQTDAALNLFRDLPLNRLPPKEQEALLVLRANLYKVVGEYDRAGGELRRTLWASPVLKAQAKRLEGDIAELRSEFSRAGRAYQEGLETVERLWSETALFRKNLAWTAMRQRDLDRAWRQALLARYEVENVQGFIQEERGRFAEAEAHYRQALALAENLGHTQGEAKTGDNLANLLARQGRFEEAQTHWQTAGQLFERTHRLERVAAVKVNRSFGYNLAGQPQAALRPAEEAMALFERLGDVYGQAVAAQNLAEAHQTLGDLEAAEQFAWQVIRTEETSTLPDGLRVLGEVKTAQGKSKEAGQFLRQAIEVAQQNQDSYLEAYAWRSLGHFHRRQRQDAEAKTAFDRAVALFETMELSEEVEKTRRAAEEQS